ncbi:hypothetical protein [Kitasatospora cineracea]|uniref:Uncharacterized protein n=1 Tax=Kitasatospora cineracea TaxID=88074 RepID=A0A8G1XFP4_9ACTN|nr:hypothetical protein [Kitasatospora cineracea]ROR46746.1 hypothetical protein EDD39_5034 [Kitasatospora cineracea]
MGSANRAGEPLGPVVPDCDGLPVDGERTAVVENGPAGPRAARAAGPRRSAPAARALDGGESKDRTDPGTVLSADARQPPARPDRAAAVRFDR